MFEIRNMITNICFDNFLFTLNWGGGAYYNFNGKNFDILLTYSNCLHMFHLDQGGLVFYLIRKVFPRQGNII